jgi:glycosyltransferase involved in cell wall biosynthesis
MSKPFVTILIDTYNHDSFIADAINSVLGQDFEVSEREILVVDDGSTDSTPDIVRRFEPQVRLLRKTNGGQASAFNAGIREAQGEIVAFLDGDDYWAKSKLATVTEAFAANPGVGLVGHGLTELFPDGRRRTEWIPRDVCRFRISSVGEARKFRMLRGFLGTSRMAYRRAILHKIGLVPESLKFEADEYLFTLAGFLTEVLILNQPLTFYRLHGGNLYQITHGNDLAARRKYRVIAALAQLLREKLNDYGIPFEIARTVLECVEVEAEGLRLVLDSGFPWETILTELKIMRVFHGDASFLQRLFSCLRLLPAIALPARTYYRWRSYLSRLNFYLNLRKRFMPFPVPRDVKRIEKPAG